MKNTTTVDCVDLDVTYPHPPERVWRALTDKNDLGKWLLPTGDFEPRPGHRFHFQAEPNENWDGRIGCEVLDVEEAQRLAYTWQPEPDQTPTLVTWTLEPTPAGGTRLRLTHDTLNSPQASLRGGEWALRLTAYLTPRSVTSRTVRRPQPPRPLLHLRASARRPAAAFTAGEKQ